MMKQKGFTLVEMMVAIFISSLVSIPVYLLYQSGFKSSISGMARLELQAEGQTILRQLKDDLRFSCMPYGGSFSLSFDKLLETNASLDELEESEYSFYRFDQAGVGELFYKKDGEFQFPVTRVSYRIERADAELAPRLTRIEVTSDGRERTRVVSECINFFQIKPVCVKDNSDKEQWFWNITLQLVKDLGKSAKSASSQTVVADFYDLTSSVFYHALFNNPLNARNFNTRLGNDL